MRPLAAGVLLVVSTAAKAQPDEQPWFMLGNGDTSCTDFVNAAQLNDRARQPGDPPGSYRNHEALAYMTWIEGFMSGTNYISTINRMVGRASVLRAAYNGS